MTRPAPADTGPLRPGEVVQDRFEILSALARGGSSCVYAARPVHGRGRLAVKVLTGAAEAPAPLHQQLFREILLSTRVRHPHIVEVLDFGVLPGSGLPFLAMELLRGATLAAWIRQHGPMEPGRAVPLFLGMLEALAAAHAQGLVHHDLKPANLFLERDRQGRESLVVLDFGIAHRERDPAEPGDRWRATPRYAAPEYLLDRAVTPALDVYQVGLVLAEVLSGRPVVSETEAAACFRAHLAGALHLPPEVTGGPLRDVIRAATALDPADRPRDAGALLGELRRCMPGILPAMRSRPPSTGPDGPTERWSARPAEPPRTAEPTPTASPPPPSPAAPPLVSDRSSARIERLRGLQALAAVLGILGAGSVLAWLGS